jgi:NitT/TauT family transport system substrate-binding protein
MKNGCPACPRAGVHRNDRVRFMKKLILIAFFLTGLVRCAHPDGPDLVLLVPNSTASTPFFMLAEEGAVLGVRLRVELFINHPQAMIRLYRGEADLLYTGTSTGWENRLDGGSIVLLNTGVWGLSYLMGKDPGIRTFSDLKGRSIALPFPGSPLDFQTRCILEKNGLQPGRDVKISYAPFQQSIVRLVHGTIDTAPLPEPLATFSERNHGLLRLIDYQTAWAQVTGGSGRSPQVSLFTIDVFARKEAVLLAGLVAQWQRKTEEVLQDPGRAARISAGYLHMPEDILETAIRNTDFLVPSYRENRRALIEYYRTVRPYLPETGGELDEGFFFTPPGEDR